jgi:hypothetical protein
VERDGQLMTRSASRTFLWRHDPHADEAAQQRAANDGAPYQRQSALR